MPTREEIEEARRVLRQAYWNEVNATADAVFAKIKSGAIKSHDDLHRELDRNVTWQGGGNEYVTDNQLVMDVLMLSDNDDLLFQQTDVETRSLRDWAESGTLFHRAASMAFEADIIDSMVTHHRFDSTSLDSTDRWTETYNPYK